MHVEPAALENASFLEIPEQKIRKKKKTQGGTDSIDV
jgi:hypothetical protein